MKLSWNRTTSLVMYTIIGLGAAAVWRFSGCVQQPIETPPIGKTILLLPIDPAKLPKLPQQPKGPVNADG